MKFLFKKMAIWISLKDLLHSLAKNYPSFIMVVSKFTEKYQTGRIGETTQQEVFLSHHIIIR